MAKAAEKEKEKVILKGKAFIIDSGDRTFYGEVKYVKFHRGIGILDMRALAEARPDWVESPPDGSFFQFAGQPPEHYAKYFDKHGFKVTQIAAEKAKKIRSALEHARWKEVPESLLVDSVLTEDDKGIEKEEKEKKEEKKEKE